jgi:cell division septum initiation protein DivIVA
MKRIVDYLAPGETKWRRQESQEAAEATKREVRRLLDQGDELASRLCQRAQRKRNELVTFERDMAFALGSWNRWAEAEAKRLMSEAQKIVESRKQDLLDFLKRK